MKAFISICDIRENSAFLVTQKKDNMYLSNGFPYLGKNEVSRSNILLNEFFMYKINEPYLGCG